MFGIFALVITVIVLAMVLWNPKWGPIFLWPMLFMYPHYYMWQRQLLPLNIGIDDLFICVLFLVTVLRRNIMGGIRPQFGYAVWATLLFFIISVTSNVNGYFVAGRVDLAIFAKAALKGIITFFLAYSLVNTIDDEEDLKRVVFSFCFFAGTGAVLVILQNYFPGPMQIFTSAVEAERAWLYGMRARPSGAFMNANNAAVVMGSAGLIIVSTLRLKSRYFGKSIRFVCLGIMVLAILMTRSRSGFLCLLIPLILMSVMSKTRRYAWLFLVLGIAAIMAFPGVREALFERFTGTGRMAGFSAPIRMRLERGVELWQTVTFRRLIFGQSMHADILLGNMPPHNAYLGIPLGFGIFGAIWAITVVTIMLRKARFTKKYADLSLAPYGSAIEWCLFAFALYCVVGGILITNYARYTLFLLAVIVQKCADITWQSSIAYDQESYMYIDQAEPIEYSSV